MKLDPRLLKEARQSLAVIILSICLGLVAGVLGIFQARQLSALINQVFLLGKNLDSVLRLLGFILLVIVLRAGAAWAGELCASSGAHKIKHSIRQRFFIHLTELGPGFLRGKSGNAETHTGELTTTAIDGIEALDAYFSQYLPQLALAVLIPVAILFFVFPSDLLSGVILLITAPLMPIFMYLIGSAGETLTQKQWRGLNRMSAYFLDILQGLTTLKSLGRSREQVDVIKKVSESYRQSTMSVLKVTFLSALVLELIATLSTAVVAVEIGIRLLYGKMAFEQAFFVLLLAPEFYLPLRMLGMRFHAGMAGVEASKSIFNVLEQTDSEHTTPTGYHPSQPAVNSTPSSIEFRDVSFTYPNRQPALQGVSFAIPAGKTTALVGESGAGKTTLTWLLLRFISPLGGEILVDGKPLPDFPLPDWRDGVAWVPQNPYIVNDTVAANIKISRPHAMEAEVQEAARMAHADAFIHQLPQGYETLVGERGTRLSAGQAQRIALARAFLKNAPFLILDEATSHLDPVMDAQLQDSLRRLSKGRTVLIIAHHKSTLDWVDQVIRLTQGRVLQEEPVQQSPSPSSPPPSPALARERTQQNIHQVDASLEQKSPPSKNGKKSAVEKRLAMLLAPYAGRILLSIFLGFATVTSGIGLMATSAYIISAAALHPSIAELQIAIVGVRFFGLSRGVFRYLERLVSHDVTFRLLASWRAWFFQALEPLAPARLLSYHSADLLSRVIGDITTLENFYVRAIAPPFVALFVTAAACGVVGIFGSDLAWTLFIFMLLAGVGLPILTLIFSRRFGSGIVMARASLSTEIVDGIQGLPDLLAGDNATAHLRKVDRACLHLNRMQSRLVGLNALQSALGSLLANLALLSVLVLAIQSVSAGSLDGVFLGVVALTALTSFEAVFPLPLAAQNFESNREAATRLYELVDAAPEVTDPDESPVLPLATNIDVDKLSFSYAPYADNEIPPDTRQFSLVDITFLLPSGKRIAILGPSGAGKTTLINLLQRFWNYHSGSILLGENELRKYHQEDIRNRMASITQNTYMFSATLLENLLIANPKASQEDIDIAIQAAHLPELVKSLPDGYNTWIGEHGLQLSAGERQRLAIARAILRDTPLLILDEPTANLDLATELFVLNSIHELSRGRTMINITQRMVGLDLMDEILVLREGHIVERGTHAKLISRQGLYSQMWALYNQMI